MVLKSVYLRHLLNIPFVTSLVIIAFHVYPTPPPSHPVSAGVMPPRKEKPNPKAVAALERQMDVLRAKQESDRRAVRSFARLC